MLSLKKFKFMEAILYQYRKVERELFLKFLYINRFEVKYGI